MRTRVWAYGLSIVLLAAVLWPLTWRLGARDSYPLSNYPMFALGRREPVIGLTHVLAVMPDGARRPVPPSLTANGTTMQAAMTIGKAVRRGEAMALCQRVAARVAARGAGPRPVELEVAYSRYHTLDYFRAGPVPTERRVHARCPVAEAAP